MLNQLRSDNWRFERHFAFCAKYKLLLRRHVMLYAKNFLFQNQDHEF